MKNSITKTLFCVLTAVALAGCGDSGGGGSDGGDEDGYIRITTPTTASSYKADMPFPDILVGGTINRSAPSPVTGGGSVGGGSPNSLACLIIWPCAILTSIFFKGDGVTSTVETDLAPQTEIASSGSANLASGIVTTEVYNETTQSGGSSGTTEDVWSATVPVTLGENVITVNAIDEWGYTSSDQIIVEISAPRYKLPIRNIDPHGFQTGEYYLNPHNLEIHSNSRGDSVIAWNDGSAYDIQPPRLVVAIYHPNSGWSNTAVITETSDDFRTRARVSIDDTGNAMVVWQQEDAIRYRRYTQATGWSAAVQLVEANLFTNNFDLVTDRRGNAYLFWHDHSKGYSEPQVYLRYDATGGWSAPVAHTEPNYIHNTADYSVDANGVVTAVWRYANRIYFAQLTGETGWNTPQQIGSYDTSIADTQIEVSDSGHIVAIWANRFGPLHEEYRISANVFHPTNGWSGETDIAAGSLSADFELSAGIDASGHIIVVWPEYADDYDTVIAVEFTHTDGWSNPHPISRAQAGDARGPTMVMRESGHALVSWAQFDGWIESIVALEFDPAAGWGQTELIELKMAAGSRNPVIGTGSDNGLFIAWEQYNDVWYETPSTHSVEVGFYPL